MISVGLMGSQDRSGPTWQAVAMRRRVTCVVATLAMSLVAAVVSLAPAVASGTVAKPRIVWDPIPFGAVAKPR